MGVPQLLAPSPSLSFLWPLALALGLISVAAPAQDDWDALFADEQDGTQAAADEPSDGQAAPAAQRPASEPARIALPESTPGPLPAASSRRQIEEIIVTAQKTEQTLQEVPVSVSAVDADSLRKAGIVGPEGIENQVPNLEMDGDPQAPSIGIRGFSFAWQGALFGDLPIRQFGMGYGAMICA